MCVYAGARVRAGVLLVSSVCVCAGAMARARVLLMSCLCVCVCVCVLGPGLRLEYC